MRNRYIVCYDVSDQKRLAKVYKKMRGFGDPVQYSIFKCDLSNQEKVIMLSTLHGIIHHNEDRIMMINLGPATSERESVVEFMGRAIQFSLPTAKII